MESIVSLFILVSFHSWPAAINAKFCSNFLTFFTWRYLKWVIG